jgi:tetratricopeptide (TPR) repeat protein
VRSIVALLLGLVALSTAALVAGGGRNDDEYARAVEAYRQNQPDEAIAVLGQFDANTLDKVARHFISSARERTSTNQRKLLSAAMLHVDTEIELHRTHRNDAIPAFIARLNSAARLFAAADASRTDAGVSYGLRSARAFALLLLDDISDRFAREYVPYALERFPDDGPLLVALAAANENDVEFGSSSHDLPSFTHAGNVESELIAAARRNLDRALEIDPLSIEARVRRAHVDVLAKNDRAAAARLEAILSSNPPDAWRYVALLFLSGIRERAGDLETAARLDADALKLYPDAQSGFVALAEVFHRFGDRHAAAVVADRLFARRLSEQSDDPWWAYRAGHWKVANPVLDQLREEARQ